MVRSLRMLLVAACAAFAFNVAPQATGTVDAAGCVKIYRIYYDSPGSDYGSNSSLNAEWIQLKSNCSANKSLAGYRVRDKVNHSFTFGAFTLRPGASVKIHTGTGSDSPGHVYQDAGWYIWNNDGDKAFLYNAGGTLMKKCVYGGGGASTYC